MNAERTYRVHEDAEVGMRGGVSGWDIGYIRLGQAWPLWKDEDRPHITSLGDKGVSSPEAVSFFAAHVEGMCKGSNQDHSQGFHPRAVTIDSPSYAIGDVRRIRVTPDLDRAYSGSPLVRIPCGVLPFCIVGVDSEMTNDASAIATLATGFDDPQVRDYLHETLGLDIEDYVDPRIASVGLFGSLGPDVEATFGAALRSTGVGLAARLGYMAGTGRLQDCAIGPYAGLSYHYGIQGGLDSSIASPAGTGKVDAGQVDIDSWWRFELGVRAELLRTARVMWTLGLGWEWSSYSFRNGNQMLAANLTDDGPVARVGPRFAITHHLGLEVLLASRVGLYNYDRPRYTLVPGVLASDNTTGRTLTMGLETALVGW